jgi:hypothetical protein
MLSLKKLTFNGIGRFTTEQVIDFTNLGSLVQVDGQIMKNGKDCGRSSGSGKTTVFNALDFLFGLNDVSNTVLQSRFTKEPLSVTGLFELDGVPLKIERSRKLLIDLGGVETTGSSKITEEKLDEIIGMPRDLFRKILHKRQREGGFFLDMGATDTHKFLTSCLGLQKEQSKILTLENRISSLVENELSLRSAVDSNRMALEASQNALSSLGESPRSPIDPSAIEVLKTRHLEAVQNRSNIKLNQIQEMKDLEASRPLITAIPFDRSVIERIENEAKDVLKKISDLESAELIRRSEVKNSISSLQLEISALQRAEQTRQSDVRAKVSANRLEHSKTLFPVADGNRAKEEAIKLGEELKKIRASLCPTCEQGWVNDAAKAKEEAILKKLQEHKKTVILGMEASKKVLTLEEEHGSLLKEVSPLPVPQVEALTHKIEGLKLESAPKAIPEVLALRTQVDDKNQELTKLRKEENDHQIKENTRTQAILVEFTKKQTTLRQTHDGIMSVLQDDENTASHEYESARLRHKSFEEESKRYRESGAKINLQMAAYNLTVAQKSEELALVQEEVEVANECKKVIKSYLSCSFEDALDSIGDTATKLIRSIPNMATATIQFEGLKETKEGKVKEEVTCLLSMDGEIGIPIKSLSGGERSSVDIGIDLSVIKFIEERTGKGIDVFILDEPFTGLDTTSIEEAVEMLKNCNVDKKLFLVEHNPVIAQSIENRITVVRDGLTSNIIQQ